MRSWLPLKTPPPWFQLAQWSQPSLFNNAMTVAKSELWRSDITLNEIILVSLYFSCVVTLFPSNGKAEINAIETAAQPTAPLLYYTSSTYFTHWLMVLPGPGANSMKVCFRRSWICCEVTHFKHGHSDNIDCSGIFRRTQKWYILYETQKAWRCSVVFLLLAVWRDLKQGLKLANSDY